MAIQIRKKTWGQSSLMSGAKTVTTTGTADTGYAGTDSAIFQLNVTAASGTSPSATVTIQDSIDNVNWNTIATFTAATGATNEVKRVTGPFGDSVRAVATITGTTPSLTFTVTSQVEGAPAT